MMRRLILLFLLLAACLIQAGSFTSGSATCPASGNKKTVPSSTKASWYIIQAPSSNTGNVYIGGSNVNTSSGVYIVAGGSLSAPPQSNTAAYDLSQTYIACTVAADTITFVYAQ